MKPPPDHPHTFDAGMRCIRCRRPYAAKADPCDAEPCSLNLGALAKRNAYRERMAAQEREG